MVSFNILKTKPKNKQKAWYKTAGGICLDFEKCSQYDELGTHKKRKKKKIELDLNRDFHYKG